MEGADVAHGAGLLGGELERRSRRQRAGVELAPLVAVTVWSMPPSLVNVTVSPTRTLIGSLGRSCCLGRRPRPRFGDFAAAAGGGSSPEFPHAARQ